MGLTSEELKKLNKEKHELMRKFEFKELTQKEYDELSAKLSQQIKQETEKLIKGEGCKVTNKQETSNVGRKVDDKSETSLIVEALMLKSTKNIEDVVNKVLEWGHKADPEKLARHVSVIIYYAKNNNKGRWAEYKWNQDEFMLTIKEDD